MSDNSQVQTIYLSKDGNTSGPFEPAQIEEMKRSGEFYRYELHWDNTMAEWAKVPPAPAPPPIPEKKVQAPAPPPLPSRPVAPAIPERPAAASTPAPAPAVTAPAPAPAPAPAVTAPAPHPVDYPAICHDYKRTQGGLATQITSHGCTLVCSAQETPPAFGKGSRVWADLFDEKSDRSLTTRATVKDLSFDGKSWKIQLIWENPPRF